MNFDFSDEQKMFADQVRRSLADTCTMKEVRTVFESSTGLSRASWKALAELGVLGAAVPEERGGAGLGALELCAAAYEIGYALAPVPFVASTGVCAEALRRYGNDSQQEKWLPHLAEGSAIGTHALSATGSPLRMEGGRISGQARLVPYGAQADLALVQAESAGGTVLALVPLNGAGVTRKSLVTLDPTRPLAELSFDGAAAEILPTGNEDAVAMLVDGAAILLAFEQVGAAQRALEMAREYALQRTAFGFPIGTYQAIKHKLADMFIKIETARVHAYWGAWALSVDAPDLPLAAAGAHLSAGEALRFAAQENVQTHGGIGFTWESDCQFFYRRAQADGLAFGPSQRWRERIVAALSAQAA